MNMFINIICMYIVQLQGIFGWVRITFTIINIVHLKRRSYNMYCADVQCALIIFFKFYILIYLQTMLYLLITRDKRTYENNAKKSPLAIYNYTYNLQNRVIFLFYTYYISFYKKKLLTTKSINSQ